MPGVQMRKNSSMCTFQNGDRRALLRVREGEPSVTYLHLAWLNSERPNMICPTAIRDEPPSPIT